jgi:hypothetical protein
MKRRDFFKVIAGFVTGIFATSAKSKEDFPIPADPLKDKFVLNHIDDCKADIKKKVAEETNRLIDPSREYFKVMSKELPPLLQKNIDDTIIKVFA